MKKVAVIMGSDSDFPVVSKAVAELKAYGVPYECHVMSAHRTPALASDFADKAKENGFGVIICAAVEVSTLARNTDNRKRCVTCNNSRKMSRHSCYRYSLQGC